MMNDNEVIEKIGKNNIEAIVKAIDKGHSFGLSYIEDSVIFQIPSSKSLRQNIINLSIDFSLQEACTKGIIGFDFRYDFNKIKNCQHIELRKNDITLTHSSGNYANFPREAKFRENLCTNQLSLFGDTTYEMRYGILMHSSTLTAGCNQKIALGVPDTNCRNWCNYIDLKKLSVSTVTFDVVNEEFDEEEFNFEMKKRVKKLLENG